MTLAVERPGARIGLIALLHTWGQTLTHHPHVHRLVPGGGVALDTQPWVACKPNFLLSGAIQSGAIRRCGVVICSGYCHWLQRHVAGRGLSSRRPSRR